LTFYIIKERDGSNRKRKIKHPKPYPKELLSRNMDPVEAEYGIAKWRGRTVCSSPPPKRVKHPKDVTRKQRKGHHTIHRSAGVPEDVLQHLDSLPRNAPCPYIVRVTFMTEEVMATSPQAVGQTLFEWMDTIPRARPYHRNTRWGGALFDNIRTFKRNLSHLFGYIHQYTPLGAGAWRLLWYSWDIPRQTKRSPAILLAFQHRDVEWDLDKELHDKAKNQRRPMGRW
jgi:hypothetical protein